MCVCAEEPHGRWGKLLLGTAFCCFHECDLITVIRMPFIHPAIELFFCHLLLCELYNNHQLNHQFYFTSTFLRWPTLIMVLHPLHYLWLLVQFCLCQQNHAQVFILSAVMETVSFQTSCVVTLIFIYLMCMSYNVISSFYQTGLIFNSWHMLCTKHEYHFNRESQNYEINIILRKIKQVMEYILKLQ